MSAGRVAVVDVGSNSIRLLLCDGIGPDGPTGERFTTVTALRRGAAADGTVTEEALGRLDTCLAAYAPRVAAFAPDEILPVGTSAVRDAPNRDRVAAIIRDRLGAELRVIEGAQEAALSFAGARLGIPGDGPIVVVDIGGGSTEIVRGAADGPEAAISMDIGVVRLTDRYLEGDPPTPASREVLYRAAVAEAEPVLAAVGADAPFVGVAGTFTTLAAIDLGAYDPLRVHRAVLGTARVAELGARLGDMPLAERREVPGLDPDRAPAIVAGALIARAVLDVAGADRITISERDLLDGAVLRMSGLGR